MKPQRNMVGYMKAIGACATALMLSGCMGASMVAGIAMPAASNLNGARERLSP